MTNETKKHNSYIIYVNSREEGKKIIKDKDTIEKKVWIDSSGTINYVDKAVSEEEFIKEKRNWIKYWIVIELILFMIPIVLNVLIRKRYRNSNAIPTHT